MQANSHSDATASKSQSRARFSIHQGPPADAQRYGRLSFAKRSFYSERHGANLFDVKAWRGKALKHFAWFSFRSEEAADAWIARQKESEDASQAYLAQRKAESAASLAAMKERLIVGTILHYSWGYEQTQCEYFQVIERKPGSVIIRAIGSREKEGSAGFMCNSLYPVPGKFIGPAIVKRIAAHGLTMDFGVATPVSPDESHYCSWYG